MKQLPILFFIFLCSTFLTAQQYIPMAVDSATWLMAYTDENPNFSEFIAYRIEGDTVVNSISYKKIYSYKFKENRLFNSTRQLIGLMRDDIAERKVYGGIFSEFEDELRTFISEESRCTWGSLDAFAEHLLYDFTLSVGDSIDNCMLARPAVITEADTIRMYGYNRFGYKITGGSDYTSMTEGIGTCIGIFKGSDCFFTGGGFSYSLVNYCIGPLSDCGLLTSTSDLSLEPQFELRPNPVADILKIDSPYPIKNLSLYNMEGRFLSKVSDSNSINLSDYLPGIYLVKIEDNLGNSHTDKVIKN